MSVRLPVGRLRLPADADPQVR